MKKIVLTTLPFLFCLFSVAQHTVVLKSGEKRNGVVLEIKDDVLYFSVNRQMTKIPLKQVSSIFFKEHVAYDGSLVEDEEIKIIKSGEYIVKYQMKDRKMIKAPKISIGTEDKGTVVVEVTINRSGTVMKSIPGLPGSTTSSNYLYTKAQFAAQSARFEQNPLGPIEQKGTIIITY